MKKDYYIKNIILAIFYIISLIFVIFVCFFWGWIGGLLLWYVGGMR